jgi:carbohydrate diacid regulator
MIPKYLAMKFLESLTEKLGYNINIIDEKGIIIASSDKSREGTFHEAAYKLIKEKGLT